MKEYYRSITELLWHFYSIINRVVKNNETIEKAEKILNKIQVEFQERLKLKKEQIGNDSSLSKAQKGKLLPLLVCC